MKKVKAIFSLAAAGLLLCGAASAEPEWKSIRQIREETPERWTQTFETPWRTIEVDAPIDVPDVDEMPIFKVTYEDQIDYALCDGFKVTENGEHDYDQGLFYATRGKCPTELPTDTNNCGVKYRADNYTEDSFGCYVFEHYPDQDEFARKYPFTGEIPNVTAEGLTISAPEALKLAEEEARYFVGDQLETGFRLNDFFLVDRYYRYRNKDGERIWKEPITETGEYSFGWVQTFGGVDYANPSIFVEYANCQGPNEARGRINISVDGNGYANVILSRFKVLEKPYDDVPIHGFEHIVPTLEKEIMRGSLRGITAVKLAYVGYYDPNDALALWLVPTWIATGFVESDYDMKPEKEIGFWSNGGYWMGLCSDYVFPAQSEEILDRWSKSRHRRDVPPIVTWDEVQ